LPSEIEQVQRRYGDRLRIVAIDIQENRETVARWAKGAGTSVTILLDTDGAITSAYGVTATPTVFVLSREGTLVGKALGAKPWTSASGHALLQRLTGS
jgi:phosphoribosylformimino-5-aminoimidazole carboxamide ribonucleotide (ProFAR) isomerase